MVASRDVRFQLFSGKQEWRRQNAAANGETESSGLGNGHKRARHGNTAIAALKPAASQSSYEKI